MSAPEDITPIDQDEKGPDWDALEAVSQMFADDDQAPDECQDGGADDPSQGVVAAANASANNERTAGAGIEDAPTDDNSIAPRADTVSELSGVKGIDDPENTTPGTPTCTHVRTHARDDDENQDALRDKPNWDSIELEYRLGKISASSNAKEYGLSKSTIQARKKTWMGSQYFQPSAAARNSGVHYWGPSQVWGPAGFTGRRGHSRARHVKRGEKPWSN